MNVTTDRCIFGFETAETEEKQESCVFLSVTVPPCNEDRYNVESGVDNLLFEVDFNNQKVEKATEQPLDSFLHVECSVEMVVDNNNYMSAKYVTTNIGQKLAIQDI
ncbi:hypothetical protein DPMN_110387 [Dreissena polymorpha]|uniref:Uncharacterized protein n=1 Tax=Dreissena polymorpha TaxID=45954 RepID=A0A9D4KCJ7_DREPO|nr:hypothetical protein DPMN_110387 [Dreissena polymorpha]